MGLHLANVTPSLSDAIKDQYARVWFSIVSLESILVVVTGRPSMVNSRDCTVSLLRLLEDEERSSTELTSSSESQHASVTDFVYSESSASGPASSQGPRSVTSVYFKHYVEVCIFAKEVVTELYHPGVRDKKWAEIQKAIDGFNKRLFRWKDNLSPPFRSASPSTDPEIESCRVALRILFHSTRTIINRPCLCRLNERLANQSHSSKLTNRNFATNCVDSARTMLNIVISKPDHTVLRRGAIWWMVLYHLKRAIIVLLLELSFRAGHVPNNAEDILTEAKAALDWFRRIGSTSPTAKQIWLVLGRLLHQAAQRVGGDTAEVMAAPEDPSFELPDGVDFGSGLPRQPDDAYDPNDPNTFPLIGLYGVSAQNNWDEFGFLGRPGGGEHGSLPQDQDMDQVGSGEQD